MPRRRGMSRATPALPASKVRVAIYTRLRHLLNAVVDPNRPFDAVVLGDTRLTTSTGQFDGLALLCSAHDVELWCPEVGGAYEWGSATHEEIMWRLFWGPHDLAWPRR